MSCLLIYAIARAPALPGPLKTWSAGGSGNLPGALARSDRRLAPTRRIEDIRFRPRDSDFGSGLWHALAWHIFARCGREGRVAARARWVSWITGGPRFVVRRKIGRHELAISATAGSSKSGPKSFRTRFRIASAGLRLYIGRVPNLANPTVFLSLVRRLVPWTAGLTIVLLLVGLYLTFFVAPPDYQQGESVKIMYLHVPAAWLALFTYVVMSVAALGTLVWRHPLADAAQKAAAPLGAAFTFVCLATGSLWGKPMWGTWWVWDARLTSVLVLFLIYLALIALWEAVEEPGRAARAAAIMTLVGAVNLPIIKYSVDWWNTLHQPASVFRIDGPAIAWSMLLPLLVMAVAATLLFVTLHMMAIRNEILRRRLRRLTILAAEHGDAAVYAAGEPAR